MQIDNCCIRRVAFPSCGQPDYGQPETKFSTTNMAITRTDGGTSRVHNVREPNAGEGGGQLASYAAQLILVYEGEHCCLDRSHQRREAEYTACFVTLQIWQCKKISSNKHRGQASVSSRY